MPAPKRSLPALLVAALAAFAASPLAAVEADGPEPLADPIEQAWLDATLHLYREARQNLQDADTREARLGRATLLLVQQPKTETNLDNAVRELEQLASVAPDAADEFSAAARYLLGRVAHVHRIQPDLATAAGHYRRLVQERPEHLLADQARIKLALIELYAPGTPAEQIAARLDALATEADALARPSSRRDFHLVLAEATRHHRLGDERLLRHYLAVDAAGTSRPTPRAHITVAIGELAARLGRTDLARTYFERFLAEFQRDNRRALVRDKLNALPPAAATPASAAL
jgi:tetratricopeptide (TPR) repeat protein